jgi:hypothetical protein
MCALRKINGNVLLAGIETETVEGTPQRQDAELYGLLPNLVGRRGRGKIWEKIWLSPKEG